MKIMLLSAGSAIHTQRWANGLVAAGEEVVCVSQHDFLPEGWDQRVEQIRLPRSGLTGYFLNGRVVAQLFDRHGCELLNAHYATGYGVLATRSGVRPRIVSVWGSDVYDFPQTSPVHRRMLRQVLTSADALASTSMAMSAQVMKVLDGEKLKRHIVITPFGVDTAQFFPAREARPDSGPIVIGTVKTLESKYGIDTLIKAFAQLGPSHRGRPLQLRIVGGGSQREQLQVLATSLGVHQRCELLGPVPHAEVPSYLQGFDIFVAASRLDSESFGVAVIEASACGLPVVVTDVGGLPEVVRAEETGLVVRRDNPTALAAGLSRMLEDAALRRRFGEAGRAWVQSRYEWRDCVQMMCGHYRIIAAMAKGGR